MDFVKNQIIRVEITDMSAEGNGVGKVDSYALFVKDAVIGDVIDARITKTKKNYGYARLERIITPSPMRIEPECTHAKRCGGCQLQALNYKDQLEFKKNKVRNNLIRIGGFDEKYIDGIMEPVIGMEEPFRYRNKAQYPIGRNKEGKIIAGFYAGRTHDIIENTDCFLGVSENKEILEIIIGHMNKHGIEPYDEISKAGLIRHVLIRKGFTSGEIMVCIILNTVFSGYKDYIKNQSELVDKLCDIEGMKSISLDFNNKNTNVIMGKTVKTIWGSDVIHDSVDGIDFAISPLSFFQVNPVQMRELYATALEYAYLTGRESVWDLYCGIGSISLFMAKKAKTVYGVEIIPEAIEDAKKNAENNGFNNTRFFVGKAEEVLPDFYDDQSDDEMKHPDVIVVDPPRKGCDEACLNTMLKMQPERIVYVSCDSATLARDLKLLNDGGYKLTRVRACDMFPQTVHTETVALMTK